MSACLLWFRQDFRLQDNPALAAALARGGSVVPVFILDDATEADWVPGGASRWWLHHSLAALDTALRTRGSRLVIARGETGEILRRLAKQTGARAVHWNRRYEPAVIERDRALKASLLAEGMEVKSFNAALLFEPHTVQNKAGRPFQVFTPYWRHCQTLPVEEPVKLKAGALPAPTDWPESLPIEDLALLPKLGWAGGLAAQWEPGEEAAQKRLRKFVSQAATAYAEQRDIPALDGTSSLSAHLHFGEIGPRQIWSAVRALSKDSGVFPASRGVQVFLSEVGWREFAHHLLFHFPQTPRQPLRAEFVRFPWIQDTGQLQAWQHGRTGYPIVDAGMRQLWQTGWMHNRVRMIVASFLVKHLRISWQEGAAWFWDTLVDADLAANTLGWQWAAGCGADAAPYFRIFNPILQGKKFDPEGVYVRRWVPELSRLPNDSLHEPWAALPITLASAGVHLGRDYPAPVVDHPKARAAALSALASLRKELPDSDK